LDKSLAKPEGEVHRDFAMLRGLLLLVFTFAAAASFAAEWDLHKIDGRDYVTADNIARFYGFNRTISGKTFTLRSASKSSLMGSAESRELYINGVKFILSFPVVEKDGQLLISRMDLSKLIEPVLRPSKIKNSVPFDTVILDAGHGGHDLGARCSYGTEKMLTLDVAIRAKKLLEKQGYKVRMTRTSDRFVPLQDRVKFANKYPNGVFVSIHFNSGQKLANGIETFSLAPRGVPSTSASGPSPSDLRLCAGNSRDQENIALATAAHSAMLSKLNMADRGVKRARFVVIRDIKIPGVLLEGGFLSNASDSKKVATAAYRQQMAVAIAEALGRYRAAVTGGGSPVDPVTVARMEKNLEQAGRAGESNGPVVIVPGSSN
jgi:N-acetylmuramoyl-L-alanine amidase